MRKVVAFSLVSSLLFLSVGFESKTLAQEDLPGQAFFTIAPGGAVAEQLQEITLCSEDLLQLVIEVFNGPPNSTVSFDVFQSTSGIVGFAFTVDGPFLDELTVFVDLDANGNGVSDPFLMKALMPGETVVDACSPQVGCIGNPLDVTVVEVISVEFEALDSPLDPNPGNGEPDTATGLRIFPDRQTPADAINRSKVRVKATVDPPQEGCTVSFKSFDIDDPSSNTTPVDPNGSAGNDNRGTPKIGALSAPSAQTDTTGVAIADFTVTKQPGDNFKVVATGNGGDFLDSLTVDGVDIKDAEGNTLPTPQAKVTEMLTVWRRVHIEVDSMGTVTGNQVKGLVKKFNSQKNVVTLDMTLPDGKNRFENGRLTVPATTAEYEITGVANGDGDWSITTNGVPVLVTPKAGQTAAKVAKNIAKAAKKEDYILTLFDNKLVVASVNGQSPMNAGGGGTDTGLGINANFITRAEDGFSVASSTKKAVTIVAGARKNDSFGNPLAFVGFPYTLVDDDDFNNDDGVNLDGDDGENVVAPDMSFMSTVYVNAYILPVEDGGGNLANNKDNVAFTLNINASTSATIDAAYSVPGGLESDDNRSDDFWVAYIMAAYQANPTVTNGRADNDPNMEDALGGVAASLNGKGAFTLLEELRDQDAEFSFAVPTLPRIVAHEIGHEFGLPDRPPGGGLMSSDLFNNVNVRFIPDDIVTLRSRVKSPGR